MGTAVRLDSVSKKFTLHHRRPRSFQDLVISLFRGKDTAAPSRTGQPPVRAKDDPREDFWALQDVSFTVEEGQTVGIIGPNGAGKSTVLKLISRIIEPTSGEIEVNGRVGALLELGAGFHPDLTGRENIYLNGSILGLRRSEIEQKMDEIIAFAELERFIDVPVKHYSSGMYVRLGFSVAVHTDPEVLLVDEVLAVGDESFQYKCMERIDELRRQRVTILFVSHNVETVRNMCSRVLWLRGGRVIADGSAEATARRYLTHSWSGRQLRIDDDEDRRWGSGEVRITSVRLLDQAREEPQDFHLGEHLTIQMQYEAESRIEDPVFGMAIHRADGTHVTGPNTEFADYRIPWVEGQGVIEYSVSSLPLLKGTYYVSVSAHNRGATKMYDYHDRLYPFRVLQSGGERYGTVTLGGTWNLKRDNT